MRSLIAARIRFLVYKPRHGKKPAEARMYAGPQQLLLYKSNQRWRGHQVDQGLICH